MATDIRLNILKILFPFYFKTFKLPSAKRKIKINIIFVCLFFSSSYFFPSFAELNNTINADTQFQFAEHYFRNQEYYRAISEYERFIYFFSKDDRHAQAMYQIGLAYLKGEKYREAVDTFNNLIIQFPLTDFKNKSLFKISECFDQLNNCARAVEYLNNILSSTDNVDVLDEAYYRRGWLYLKMRRFEKAEESFGLISEKNRTKYKLKTLSSELNKKNSLETKNPTIAGILAFLPGAGHLYCKRYRDAAVAFLLNSAMIFAAYESFDSDLNVLGGLITFFELGLYSGNIYSAVNCAHKFNQKAHNRFFERLYKKTHILLGIKRNRDNKSGKILLTCHFAF